MRRLDVMFWPELKGDAVLPIFEFSVKFANRVEEFSICLLGSLDGVQPFVDITLDD